LGAQTIALGYRKSLRSSQPIKVLLTPKLAAPQALLSQPAPQVPAAPRHSGVSAPHYAQRPPQKTHTPGPRERQKAGDGPIPPAPPPLPPASIMTSGARAPPSRAPPGRGRAGRRSGRGRPGAAGRMRPARRRGRAQDVGAGRLRVPGEAGPRAGAGGPVGRQGLAHHGAEPLPRRLQHTGNARPPAPRTGAARRSPTRPCGGRCLN